MKKRAQEKACSLGEILSFIAAFRTARFLPWMIAICSFGLLIATVVTFFEDRIATHGNVVLERAHLTEQSFIVKAQQWLQSMSDEERASLFLGGLSHSTMTDSDIGAMTIAYFRAVAPWVAAQWIAVILILHVAKTYFYLLFMRSSEHAFNLLYALPLMSLKMAVTYFFLIVRSFAWIPLIGVPMAVYLLPRLILAPSLLAGGQSSLVGCLAQSMQATKGRWIAVFLCTLFMITVSCVILWLSLVLGSIVALFTMKIGFLLWIFGFLAAISFACAFEAGMVGTCQ